MSDWTAKSTALTVGWCAAICAFIPIAMYLVTGELFTMTGSSVPGIDSKSIHGWLFLVVSDMTMITTGYFMVVSFDGLSFVIFANMPMVALVIQNYLKEFDELVQTVPITLAQRNLLLLNAASMQHEYSK